jgi:hypothetical protein
LISKTATNTTVIASFAACAGHWAETFIERR